MWFCAQICFIVIEVRICTLSTWLQEEMTALAKIIAELQIQSCAWLWLVSANFIHIQKGYLTGTGAVTIPEPTEQTYFNG